MGKMEDGVQGSEYSPFVAYMCVSFLPYVFNHIAREKGNCYGSVVDLEIKFVQFRGTQISLKAWQNIRV